MGLRASLEFGSSVRSYRLKTESASIYSAGQAYKGLAITSGIKARRAEICACAELCSREPVRY